MLPKRKKDKDAAGLRTTLVWLIHAGYWLVYLLLLSVVFTLAQTQAAKTRFAWPAIFPLLVLCVAPNLVSFYSFYAWLFTRFLARRRIFALALSGALVCLFSALAGAALSAVFFGFEQAIFRDGREFATLSASLFIIAAIHGAVALNIRGFVSWYAGIKSKEDLARRNFEIELALIKSQINPHFLFNTINNIDVLINRDPALASVYLNKLSAILRYMVYETRPERISLARELDYIEKYLDLQKIRTTNPDYVDFQVSGATENLEIAPMIFFPFIENAFKHTENKKSSSTIRVGVRAEKERIVFECENPYQTSADPKQDFGGLGNELIKKRLALTYPGRHLLEIDDRDQIYRVKLTLL